MIRWCTPTPTWPRRSFGTCSTIKGVCLSFLSVSLAHSLFFFYFVIRYTQHTFIPLVVRIRFMLFEVKRVGTLISSLLTWFLFMKLPMYSGTMPYGDRCPSVRLLSPKFMIRSPSTVAFRGTVLSDHTPPFLYVTAFCSARDFPRVFDEQL